MLRRVIAEHGYELLVVRQLERAVAWSELAPCRLFRGRLLVQVHGIVAMRGRACSAAPRGVVSRTSVRESPGFMLATKEKARIAGLLGSGGRI
jgi:hypothetical protein